MSVSNTHAQVNRAENSAYASAKVACFIISPIGIIKVRDMHFGQIVSGNAGTVILSPEGGRPLVTGNVALGSDGSNVSSASFEVSDGLANNPNTKRFYSGYSITLPSTDVYLVNENGRSMKVSNFTSNPSSSGYGNFVNGEGVLSIGATLFVNAEQELGNYASSAPFPVTVNFY